MPRNRRLMQKAQLDGFAALSDEELVAIVVGDARLRSQGIPAAAQLLRATNGLAGLSRLPWRGLLGPLRQPAAVRLAASVELGLRCAERRRPARRVIRCSDDVVRIVGPRLASLPHEQVWVVALDGTHSVLGQRRVAEGGQHGCALLARDVLRVVLSMGATSFLLVHNHPDNDPSPSRHDIDLTHRLARAASCVGIPLVDHVIVSQRGSASLVDLGLMPAGNDQSAQPAVHQAEQGSRS